MKKTIVFTIIFILVFSSFTFASDTYNPSIHRYWYKYGSYYYVSDFQFIVKKFESGWYLNGPEGNSGYYFECNYENGQFVVVRKINGTNRGTGSLDLLRERITASNYDIVNITDNTVFFSKAGIREIIQEETVKILPDLVGKTKTILLVGFGLLFAMLLPTLLTTFFRRFSSL